MQTPPFQSIPLPQAARLSSSNPKPLVLATPFLFHSRQAGAQRAETKDKDELLSHTPVCPRS